MYQIENLFDLDEAVNWIEKNSFKCVALELPDYLLRYSVDLVKYLNLKLNTRGQCSSTVSSTQDSLSSSVEFYAVVLNCCSVDYVSPRHLNGQIDALIRFGKCCLASLPKGIVEYPVLFMFENRYLDDRSNDFMLNYLTNTFIPEDSLLIVDTNCLIPTLRLIEQLSLNVSIGKFIKFTNKWTFVERLKDYFVDLTDESSGHSSNHTINSADESANLTDEVKRKSKSDQFRFYNYLLDKELIKFKRLYFVGDRVPNSLKILSLLEVVHLNPVGQTADQIQTNKELMKRCSLIEKVKKLGKFGVVFSHAYPDVNPFIEQIKKLAKRKKKQVNFITLVQTTDEFKLGNFPALESLILVNNCYCSHLIDTIRLHVPLLNYDEFRISCGLKLEYGQVKWNEDLDEDEEDVNDEAVSNQLVLDDRNTALVESYLKADRWFGLQVNAGKDEIGHLKQGLKGIAMGYDENGLKK